MKLFTKTKHLALIAMVSLMASPAMANTGSQANMQDDEFYDFFDTVKGWTGGPLGMGLAITMLLMGGAIGVSKNSPMPALSGIGGAAFLHWGPGIIENMMSQGAVL